jgi:hypothetical protein
MSNAIPVNEWNARPIKYSWPGGYPVFYVTEHGNVLCSECAATTTEDNPVTDCDANWEDPDLYCEKCSNRIESAYADKEDQDEV